MCKKDYVNVLVSDIDGTFNDRNGKVPERNKRAIEELCADGGFFTVATGRFIPDVERFFPDIASLVNCPALTANGALMSEVYTHKEIKSCPLDGRYAADAFTEVHKRFPEADVFYVSDEGRLNLFDENGIVKYKAEKWYKVCVRGNSCEETDAVTEFLKSVYGDGFVYSKSSPCLGEYNDRRASKGKMLDSLRVYLENKTGKTVRIYAMGDYLNDIELLKHADYPACPANACDAVKKMCKSILCDHNDGAAAELYEIIKESN